MKILNHNVSITVPSVDKTNRLLRLDRHIQYLRSLLSKAFGGVTQLSGRGAWIDSDDVLVEEAIQILCSSFEDANLKSLTSVLRKFWRIGFHDMNQACLSVEIDGTRLHLENTFEDWQELHAWLHTRFPALQQIDANPLNEQKENRLAI